MKNNNLLVKIIKQLLIFAVIFALYFVIYKLFYLKFGIIGDEPTFGAFIFAIITFLFYKFSKNKIFWITLTLFFAFSWFTYGYFGLNGTLIPFKQEGDSYVEAGLVTLLGTGTGALLGILMQMLYNNWKRKSKNG